LPGNENRDPEFLLAKGMERWYPRRERFSQGGDPMAKSPLGRLLAIAFAVSVMLAIGAPAIAQEAEQAEAEETPSAEEE